MIGPNACSLSMCGEMPAPLAYLSAMICTNAAGSTAACGLSLDGPPPSLNLAARGHECRPFLVGLIQRRTPARVVEGEERMEGISVAVGQPLFNLLDIALEARKAVLLRGQTGIGKSECVKDWAASHSMTFWSLSMPNLDAIDLSGMPFLSEPLEGGRRVTSFTHPDLLPPSGDPGKHVVLLDELNRGQRDVRQAVYTLLTARELHGYRLPESTQLIAAVNPEDGYDVDAMDPALLARLTRLEIHADRQNWLSWARSNAVFAGLLRFVESYPEAFDRSPPRCWVAAGAHLEAALSLGRGVEAARPLVFGALNAPIAAEALLLFVERDFQHLDVKLVLADPRFFIGQVEAWRTHGLIEACRLLMDRLADAIGRDGTAAAPDSDALLDLAAAAGDDLNKRLVQQVFAAAA